jgi:uncharacterized ParB-like nuclease family protein
LVGLEGLDIIMVDIMVVLDTMEEMITMIEDFMAVEVMVIDVAAITKDEADIMGAEVAGLEVFFQFESCHQIFSFLIF